MRIWIRTLLATTFALLTGCLIPLTWTGTLSLFDSVATFSIGLGRYILFPLVFFSLTIRVFDLCRERSLKKILGQSSFYIISSTLLFSVLGTFLAFFLKGIPIKRSQEIILEIPTLQEILSKIFPENFFLIFQTDGQFLIPIVIFALLLGINLNYDRIASRPIAELFDSLSKLFYNLNLFLLKISFLGIFFILTASIFELRKIEDLTYYNHLIIFYSIVSISLIFFIYPFILFIFTKNKNPYKILFGMMTPMLAAFFSGNLFYSIPLSIAHNEKNLGIDTKTNIATTSLAALFGRAGTALITSSSTILLMKSYTSVSYIGFKTILSVILLSFALSFFTGAFHRRSIIASVSIISTFLNTNNNEYLSLVIIAPILYCFAALIDSVNNTVMSYIVNNKQNEKKIILARKFL